MTTVLFFNVNNIPDQHLGFYMKQFPEYVAQEIGKYRQLKDRKLKLAGRLMLKKCVEDSGHPFRSEQICLNTFNKPFLEGWDAFNISHSQDIAVFCHDKYAIGIDIEWKRRLLRDELLNFFHADELAYIKSCEDVQSAMYKIWVKKEALLKAIGVGLTEDPKKFCCTEDIVKDGNTTWQFSEIMIHPDYTCYLCRSEESEIILKEFSLPQEDVGP